jgi:2-phosphoglycerate kinase
MKTFVVGGVPRSGKSTIQKIMLEKHGLAGISTDLLREGLIIGVPEFGIKEEGNDFDRAKILWPYFRGILKAREYFDDDLLIEGTNFLPENLSEFKQSPNMRICFLGYADIDAKDKLTQLRANRSHNDNWTDDLTDDDLLATIKEWIEDSKFLRNECDKYGIQYFDTSVNFDTQIKQALQFLLAS